MNQSPVDAAIGGVLVVLFLWLMYAAVRLVWRLFTKAIDRTPQAVELAARAAGSAAARAERVASKAAQAFKEGRDANR